jgi:hypothetical protein
MPEPVRCGDHGLAYREFHADAERRHRAGQRQRWCPTCSLWSWPDHLLPEHVAGSLSIRAFNAMARTAVCEIARHAANVAGRG